MTINKRLVTSSLTIVASGALLVGATFALFTDQAQSIDNSFSTGNADLQIANDSAGAPLLAYTDSISGVSASGLAPGSTLTKLFWLKNSSTATGISLSVTADLTDLTGNTEVGGLADKLLVKWRCDTNGNGLSDNSYTAEFSVRSWVDGGNASLGTIGPNASPSNAGGAFSDGDEFYCEMAARVDSEAGNEIATKTIGFDGIYDATQVGP